MYSIERSSIQRVENLRKTLILVILALAATVVACGSSSSSSTTSTPTAPTSTTTPTTSETFSGLLNPKGASSYSYSQVITGPVIVTLASLMAGPIGPAVSTALGLGTGTPTDTDCTVASSMTVVPALTAQISSISVSPGTYCVRVFDIGSMTVPLYFAVRIAHS